MVAGVLVAACGTSPSSPTTTTTHPGTTTTTTLTPSQLAELQPKLLTVADFPTGWTLDTAPNAASTKNTPACLANVVLAKGSLTRANAVFVGPGSQPSAVIQTVATFAPGQAAKSARALKAGFLSCDGGTLSQGGQTARLAVGPVTVASTGEGGFAAEMVISASSAREYLDAFYGVKGNFATVLIWRSSSPSTTGFKQAAAKALARL
jgi:hypothetical protein